MKQVKIEVKNILKLIGLTILSSFIGYILLIIAFSLPTDNILNNLRYTFNKGTVDIESIMYGKSSMFPNTTEKIILNIASYPSKNPIKDSLRVGLFTDEELNDVMYKNIEPKYIENTENNYGRYWHGAEIIVKPLLNIMTYEKIRNILLMMMILLLTYTIIKIKKYGNNLFMGVILSFIFLNPITTSLTITEFFSMALTFVSMCFIINMKEKNLNDIYNYQILFCIIGISITYFDILRFPLVTLGMPLVLYIYLFYDDLKTNIINIIKLSISWGIGYSLMWFMKWVLYSIVLNENKFGEIISQVFMRTSSIAEEKSINLLHMFIRIIYASIQFSWPILLVSAFSYYIIKKKICIDKNKLILFSIYLLMPVLYVIILKNHSYIHTHLAYRNFIIPIFASFALFVKST